MRKIILLLLAIACAQYVAAQAGLRKGDAAPPFSQTDNSGKKIELANLLKQHKYVVLFFYRGQWCPYCNKHIQQLQDSLQLLTAKDAYVIGVTPETAENIGKTIEKTKASFSMVQDAGNTIMKAYNVAYVMDDATVAKYKTYGVDLEKNNGNTDHMLPVPATYIIDRSGKIKFVHFNKDYRQRASVAALLAEL
jgi:peroxiredoxin